MILWEMTTMTKPFEMMGREQFLKQVVSSCCSARSARSRHLFLLCFATEVKPLFLALLLVPGMLTPETLL